MENIRGEYGGKERSGRVKKSQGKNLDIWKRVR